MCVYFILREIDNVEEKECVPSMIKLLYIFADIGIKHFG